MRRVLIVVVAVLATGCGGRKDTAKCHKACEEAHEKAKAACPPEPPKSAPPTEEKIDAGFAHVQCVSAALEPLIECVKACDD